MTQKQKILITGGNGFIGSHTIIDLLEKGYEIISIDNQSRSKQLIGDRIKEITHQDFASYKVDCRDLPKLRNIIAAHPGISGIIHFAAFKSVSESVEKPLIYFDNNINSTINMLRIAEEYGIPNFVFSSSCSVYGNTKELPVTENTPIASPESPYGLTKLFAEQMIEAHAKTTSTNFISLRYFNPVGAHESGLIGEIPYSAPENLIPNITQTAIGKKESFTVFGNKYPTRDGSCIRDYIHVMDIAEAHTQALQYLMENKNESNYEVFNLGSGYGVSVLELIAAFERVSGKQLNYTIGEPRQGDVITIYADNTKAKEKLHWQIKRDIDSMMLSAWNWEIQMQKEDIN